MFRFPLALLLLVVAAVSGVLPAQAAAGGAKLRGYAIMAGGLGRSPRSAAEMWPNTIDAHLDFIDAADINLVAIEVPYGLSKRHPKSPDVSRLIAKLRQRKVAVWILYPHVLAQTFDLPRQVGRDGKRIEWNCCCNDIEVQDWLVDNGVRLVEAYAPDALILFGTFHVGGHCHCENCKAAKTKESLLQERFFQRLDTAVAAVAKDTRIGTCDYWVRPTKATQQVVDLFCPVVPIFRPGYAEARQVTEKLRAQQSKAKGAAVVPYVKVFLASQTNSNTGDLVGAMREATRRADGFFLWGYNPGHVYRGQDYDHAVIRQELSELAASRRR